MTKLILLLIALSTGMSAMANSTNQVSDFLTSRDANKFTELSETYYPKQDLTGKQDVYIGMAAADVIENSNWGQPDAVSTMVDQLGKHETWVYGRWEKVLYLSNDKVIRMQY